MLSTSLSTAILFLIPVNYNKCVYLIYLNTFSLDFANFALLLVALVGFMFLLKSVSLIFLLIVSELAWITLYSTTLVMAITFNSLLFLGLSFFFLMFSAAEISLGLFIFYIQNYLHLTLSTFNVPQST